MKQHPVDTCPICQILQDPTGTIYETNLWRVALAPEQKYLGRCYVTLKRHAPDLPSLTQEEWSDFIALVTILERTIKKAFNAQLGNWSCLMNNAYQVSPAKPHVHWHFRPRYDHPVEILETTFEDKEFGFHYDRNNETEVSAEVQKAIIEAFQAALKP